MTDECPKCPDGLPPWLATFADLMSLLMCFFVLLLSFAEIDAIRFKKMAESMKDAFGVQRDVPVMDVVKGVSVIKQEWSPSFTDPSVVNEIRQKTTDVEKPHLEEQPSGLEQGQQARRDPEQAQALEEAIRRLEADLQGQYEELQTALDPEIEQGLVTVEREESKVIIRIQEKGSFPSGSAMLDPGFHEVIDRISQVLAAKPGKVVVAGHTDDVPIRSGRFRSNWELSAARAVTVLHSLLRNPALEAGRVVVEGYAETRPLAPNDNVENRARNRRVELLLIRGDDQVGPELRALGPGS